jgi:UDP-N-acetylmuramoylalanine--D-glutamate ligase
MVYWIWRAMCGSMLPIGLTQTIIRKPQQEIRKALSDFKGLPHRLQLIATVGTVSFYNDSVATTPESTAAAAEALAGNAVFILGGYDKHVDLKPAVEAVAAHAAAAVCIGATGPALKQALEEQARPDFIALEAGSLDEAVAKAFELAAGKGPGVVALSPACASYDMFSNFEDRGNQFAAIVKNLP